MVFGRARRPLLLSLPFIPPLLLSLSSVSRRRRRLLLLPGARRRGRLRLLLLPAGLRDGNEGHREGVQEVQLVPSVPAVRKLAHRHVPHRLPRGGLDGRTRRLVGL